MSIIEPLDRDKAEASGLGSRLSSSDELGVPGESFLRILAHVPGYAEAIHDAMYRAHADGAVDHTLKEIIRIQLARFAQDPYFAGLRSRKALAAGLTEEQIDAGSGDFEGYPGFTSAEKWALRYSYLMYRAPEKLDAAFYEEGKGHYSEAQIMEIGGMIALHYGMQVFMRTLGPHDAAIPEEETTTQESGS